MAYLYIVGSTSTPCPCCGGEDCFLTVPAIPFDGTDDPFADETEAQDALDDQAIDCLAWGEPSDPVNRIRTGASASVSGDTLTAAETVEGVEVADDNLGIKIVAPGAGTISIPYSLSAAVDDGDPVDYVLTAGATLYDLDGNVVDNDEDEVEEELSLSGTLNLSVPAAGEYYVLLQAGFSGSPGLTTQAVLEIDFEAAMTGAEFCPIRAAYDDGGGGTDYLVCA